MIDINKFKINYNIIVPIILMAIISIISIYSSLTYTSSELGNLSLKQCIWYLIGIILIIIIIKYKNEFIYRHSKFLYILGNVLLFLLLIFGIPINNSKCWFIIPGIGGFQPSEFMKIFLIIFLAKMIHNFKLTYNNPSIFDEFIFILKTFIVVLIPSILTFLEPDTGAIIIYFVIYIFMMFISGIRLRWFISATLFISIIMGSLLFIYFCKKNVFINLFGTSLFYRLDRILDWKKGTGMQLENALTSIGSSGLVGHGFNKTPLYFPESSTDFIFAVYSSNFGIIGSLLLFIFIIIFDINILLICKENINYTDKFVLIGIISMIVFQQIQNIGMTIGLFPIMGITLPFISYGGSSLLSYMILIGIILNVLNTKKGKYNI